MPIELTAVKKSRARERTPIDEIDEDVKTAVLESLKYCQEHPDERVSAQFETQEAADEFLFEARSFAYQATPRLIVAGNPTQKGAARFTVTLWGAGSESESDAA